MSYIENASFKVAWFCFISLYSGMKERISKNKIRGYTEAYSGPCQTSKMGRFAKIVNTEAATRNEQEKAVLKNFAIFAGKQSL